VDKFLPTEDGEPPLARAKDWYYDEEKGLCSPPLRGGAGGGVLEFTTMPGWAGSSWYYLRYMDPQNEKEFVSKAAADYWKDVDFYLGGSEHATGHLLYVRFWTKFLKDRGFISIEEPAKKLVNQGMIQGETKFVGVAYKSLNPNYTKELLEALENIDLTNAEPNDESELTKPDDTIEMLLFPLNLGERLPNTLMERIPVEFVSFFNGEYYLTNEELEKLKTTHSKFQNARIASMEDYFSIWKVENNQKKPKIEDRFFVEKVWLQPEVEKMSKSKWNVVNPDDLVEKYGADTLRMYEMFLGPLEQSKPWNTNGITGVSGFLKKFWKLYHPSLTLPSREGTNPLPTSPAGGGVGQPANANQPEGMLRSSPLWGEAGSGVELKILHNIIKKITDDIEKLSLNTCVSTFMICVNELTDLKCNKKEILEPLVILIAPFAPHIAEELWKNFGHNKSVTFAKWPEYKAEYTIENSFSYPVSFNGKTRFFHELDISLSKEEVEKEVMELEQTQKYLEGKQPKKVIVVPKKIVNIVV